MEPLKIAVCEDEPEEAALLCRRIQANNIPTQVECFAEGEPFWQQFCTGSFDLIFMDIYGISGVELVQRVRQQDMEIPIAFTTISKDHALDGYRLDVAKYIEKPVSQPAVDAMLALALEHRERQSGILVQLAQSKPLRIPADRLLYAEQHGHYLLFHLAGGRVLQAKGRLDELEPQLAAYPFFRCHKSYLANLSFVTDIDREQMVFRMREGSAVYIRRGDFRRARTAWENWLFDAARNRSGPWEG